MKKAYKLLFFLLCYFPLMEGKSQQLLQVVIEEKLNQPAFEISSEVKEFYKYRQYIPAWIVDEKIREQLFVYFDSASNLGLRSQDYNINFISSLRKEEVKVKTPEDSLLAEIKLTDLAIHFFKDVAFGNHLPDVAYNGLNQIPSGKMVVTLLAESMRTGNFHHFLEEIEPKSAGYIAIKNKIIQYNRIIDGEFYRKDINIVSGQVDEFNKPLLQKLYEHGFLSSPSQRVPTIEVKTKLKALQLLFSMSPDMMLNAQDIRELNIPIEKRIESLAKAINAIRWLRSLCTQNSYIFLINIPSANLLVLEKEKVFMESKVVVGKLSTRTPTLSSNITEIVLYPYWMVPYKIATRELLPIIKHDIKFLEAGNFQVVNSTGKVLDPYSINWSSLSTNFFPYTLRQSTGCDNSLGIVKFNFYSPFGVYLHDTPAKAYFSSRKRYFSHGCIRVEKAIELAHLLLNENTLAIDTLEEKGCVPDQKPIPIPTREKIPIVVLYNTAWIDSSATVRFYEDVYKKNTYVVK